jgi:hypothetical protein
MVTRWRRLVACIEIGLLIAAGIAGCEGALVIPSGAQTVHATVTRDSVRLEPETVHAGMVYLTVDTDGSELVFISGIDPGSGEGNPPRVGGLTDARLDAILHGDLANASISSGFRSGGELGNASELGELQVGKYLFLAEGSVNLEPEAGDAIPLDAVAVLEVVP